MKFLLIGLIWIVSMLTACSPRANERIVLENTETLTDAREDVQSKQDGETDSKTIYVYVCGYVKEPGVYALSDGARICDALELAGGVDAFANPEALHQAQLVTDGQTIYVPSKEEALAETDRENDLIDINKADKELLMTLPGIGAAKADLIINYRNEHGAFQKIEELMDIPGIKEGLFEKIKDSIKVS